MRKVRLYIAQSLDGFIAREDGKVDWLEVEPGGEEPGTDYGYAEFLAQIDTTLMGYNTYREILGFGIPFPYPDKTNYVFSRNHKKEDENPVEFISSDATGFVANLKSDSGKDIWLIGGAELNRVLLDAGLIDEIIVTTKSTLLGSGIPLFGKGNESNGFYFQSVQLLDKHFIQYTLQKK